LFRASSESFARGAMGVRVACGLSLDSCQDPLLA
jgi:hypothetical protein